MTSTATLIALLVGTVIPGITALVTRDEASPKVKAIVTAGLSAVSGGLTAYLTSPPQGTVGWETFIGTILITWVASAASYFFGWKPTGASAAVARRTASFGVGGPVGPEDPPSWRRWAALGALVVAVAGIIVGFHMSSPQKASVRGVLPGAGSGGAYVVSCSQPGTVAYSGTSAQAATWVSAHVYPDVGCWTTYYFTPSTTTTTVPPTSTTVPPTSTTTTTVPPTTTEPPVTTTTVPHPTTTTTAPLTPEQIKYEKWCAKHPNYYGPARCPTHVRAPVAGVGP